jgi:divalent metal cation (Fe/Co/Zn/Cd) transporter
MWDALGSIAIGLVLILVAAGIGYEIKGLLIGQSAEPATEQRLREFLEGREEVEKVYRMITMQLGTSLMVALKAKMKATSAAQLVADINRAEQALRAEFPEIQWLFFEPDIAD